MKMYEILAGPHPAYVGLAFKYEHLFQNKVWAVVFSYHLSMLSYDLMTEMIQSSSGW